MSGPSAASSTGHAGIGRWAFMVCKEPNRLREMLDAFATGPAAPASVAR